MDTCACFLLVLNYVVVFMITVLFIVGLFGCSVVCRYVCFCCMLDVLFWFVSSLQFLVTRFVLVFVDVGLFCF